MPPWYDSSVAYAPYAPQLLMWSYPLRYCISDLRPVIPTIKIFEYSSFKFGNDGFYWYYSMIKFKQ